MVGRSTRKRKHVEPDSITQKTTTEANPRRSARSLRTASGSQLKQQEQPVKKTNQDAPIKHITTNGVSAGQSLHANDAAIDEVVTALLLKKKKVVTGPAYQSTPPSGSCFLHYMQQLQMGSRTRPYSNESVSDTVVSHVEGMRLSVVRSSFCRRCTVLEWHPTRPHHLAVTSKWGEITIMNVTGKGTDIFIPGTGPNGSIQALKFLPHDHERIITASINGTVSLHTLGQNQKQVFMDTLNSHDDWYCSLDFHPGTDVVTVGDNHGNVTLKALDGTKVFEGRLHRQKVTHVEYSPREAWLLVTASVDHTVQLWDIRMLKDRRSSLAVLRHEKPVNSAYFSLTTGTRLLTTDQGSEVRVYTAPTFEHPLVVKHPHRQFQHLTPIKAYWHPLQDLIVVGRYPHEQFPGYTPGELRTIDILDTTRGQKLCHLHDNQAKGIVSLNKFSHNGEYLASTMGLNILIWKKGDETTDGPVAPLVAAKNSSRKARKTDGKSDSKKQSLKMEKTALSKLSMKAKGKKQ